MQPLKAAIPALVDLPEAEQARRFRRTLELVRMLGLVGHLRGVEQTPETSFVLPAALRAYPQARARCTCCATGATSSARCSSAAG